MIHVDDSSNDPQERAIEALMVTGEITAAAEQVGVSRSTLHRWLRDPDFRVRYTEARRVVAEQALAVMQRECTCMARVLVGLATGKIPPNHVRLQAAAKVLEFALGASEIGLLRDELAELRQAVADLRPGHGA